MAEQSRVIGTQELSAKLKLLAKAATGDQLDRALLAGGFVVEAEAKRNVRSQGLIDTGNLRASIRAQRERPGVVIVGTQVIYAAIHEFGGTISAKNSPFLTFQVGGKWVRVKSVNIPARPYLRPAFDQRDKIMGAIERTLKIQIGAVAAI